MTIDLTGKIALVTGGGNGIGAASCRALAKAGARIAVIDRDGEAAAKVASEIGGGALLYTASTSGLVGSAFSPVYSMAKFGVVGFVRSLAKRLAPDNIRVNAVCPGPTATAFGGGQIPSAARKAERARKIPLGRMVEAADIADAVLFLASDLSRMCTGIALDVDGGVLISNDIPYEEYFARAR